MQCKSERDHRHRHRHCHRHITNVILGQKNDRVHLEFPLTMIYMNDHEVQSERVIACYQVYPWMTTMLCPVLAIQSSKKESDSRGATPIDHSTLMQFNTMPNTENKKQNHD